MLYGSWARRLAGPDYPYGPTAEELEDVVDGMERAWATGEWWDGGQSNAFDDERHRRWWARYLRMAASPAMAQNVIRMNMRLDIRDVLPRIDVPTLILHRTGDTWIDVGHARYLARAHPERDLRRAARDRITGRGSATSTRSRTRSRSS